MPFTELMQSLIPGEFNYGVDHHQQHANAATVYVPTSRSALRIWVAGAVLDYVSAFRGSF